jgi:pimeloyl-ACP methyl ester carboxylesterase
VLPLGLPALPQHANLPGWLSCGPDDQPLNATARGSTTFAALLRALSAPASGTSVIAATAIRYFSYDPTSLASYAPSATRQPLATSAATLEAELQRWHRAEPTATFDLIGHSLGGDVILLWAVRYATADDLRFVHSIVTLDAPVIGYPQALYAAMHSYLTALFGSVVDALPSDSSDMQAIQRAPLRWEHGAGDAASAVYNAGNIRDLVVPAFTTTLAGADGLIDDFGPGPDGFNHGAVLASPSLLALIAGRVHAQGGPTLAAGG